MAERLQSDPTPVPKPRPLPPYLLIPEFLDRRTVGRLFDYAVANEAAFQPMTVRYDKIDSGQRSSVGLFRFGPLQDELKTKILQLVPELISRLRVTPFETRKIETELVCHGDGAFFKRHIDTYTGNSADATTQRMISAVWYFHREPKAFTGGELRLFAFGSGQAGDRSIDLEPHQNTLVAFPSWAPHEVLPISCPTKCFLDSRFSVNFWIHRSRPADRPETMADSRS